MKPYLEPVDRYQHGLKELRTLLRYGMTGRAAEAAQDWILSRDPKKPFASAGDLDLVLRVSELNPAFVQKGYARALLEDIESRLRA